MGKMKNFLLEKEEALRSELREVDNLINDSIDRGESREERNALYSRSEELVHKLLDLPGVDPESI